MDWPILNSSFCLLSFTLLHFIVIQFRWWMLFLVNAIQFRFLSVVAISNQTLIFEHIQCYVVAVLKCASQLVTLYTAGRWTGTLRSQFPRRENDGRGSDGNNGNLLVIHCRWNETSWCNWWRWVIYDPSKIKEHISGSSEKNLRVLLSRWVLKFCVNFFSSKISYKKNLSTILMTMIHLM